MLRLRSCSTQALRPEELTAVRRLLEAAFPADFTEQDWQHTLGGTHVILTENGRMVAHAAVVPRTLWYGRRALHTGYVEGVAVRTDQRRRGHATRVLRVAAEHITSGHELGALADGSRVAGFYERLGWLPWTGPTWVRTPHGARRTATDDGCVLVLPTPHSGPLDPTAPLTCDWREGEVW